MAQKSKRQELFENRIETAWKSLLADIERWQNSSLKGETIKHHVEQFYLFCQNAYQCLIQNYEKGGWTSVDDELVFKALVARVLTSQWDLFSQVAAQRLPGSPYEVASQQFDERTVKYYYRLREAIPEETRHQLSPSPPLVYIGRLSELKLVIQNELALSVLSVPFSVLDDERSVQAIPHEIGHTLFVQLPECLEELEHQLWDSLLEEQPNPQIKSLYAVMMNWLDEIVADLVGTALGGPDFADSGLWVSVSPDAVVGRTDREHPVALVRPFIHLEALDHLSPSFGADYATKVGNLKTKVDDIVNIRLDYRFESTSDLTVVSLRTVRNELRKVVRLILKTPLSTLQGQSLGDVLVACATNEPESVEVPLQNWGVIPKEVCERFILDLPESTELNSATPEAASYRLCWFITLPGC